MKHTADDARSTKRSLGGLFGASDHALKRDKVREYFIHRIKAGAHLDNVVEEPYVQRNCTRSEINEIVRDPRLVHAARESMEHTFDSGELDPKAGA